MTIAEKMHKYMIENDYEGVMWGDGHLADMGYDFCRCTKRPHHPLNDMSMALGHMERRPDLFEKGMVRGMDCRGRERIVRGFWVKK